MGDMPDVSRRDMIKWVLYLSAVSVLPELASPPLEEFPHDVLEGISSVYKKIADISGDAAKFRAAEDAAFEEHMRAAWREYNKSARYVRVVRDAGVVPEHEYRDPDTGEARVRPE